MRAKSTDGRPEGEPYRHVKEALAVDPNHVAALAFAGHAEAERGDPAVSAALWERLLKQLPTDSPIFARVKDIVGDARKRAAAQPR